MGLNGANGCRKNLFLRDRGNNRAHEYHDAMIAAGQHIA